MSQIHDLYSYLKDKYGIPGTEKNNPPENENIESIISIMIPGLSKNTERHEWIIFIEIPDDKKSISLIVGQNWKDKNSSWSRYIEILDNCNKEYPYIFLEKISRDMFNEIELKNLEIFINVFQDFSKNIKIID